MDTKKCTCENPTLAMASIPIQSWTPPYDHDRALKIGTIFPDLNKPVFCGDDTPLPDDSCVKSDKTGSAKCLLKKINEISFTLTDLALFLDTHPDCDSAISLYQQTMKQRKTLLEEFAKNYYPLTQDCIEESNCNGKKFCWTAGPAPWEGDDALCSITKKD